MIFDDLKKEYPLLTSTANYLEERCYFFKGVLLQLREIDPNYAFGEELCQKALALCGGDEKEYYKKSHSLIEFSLEFLRLQIGLEKTGRYQYSSFKQIEDNVYNDPSRSLNGPWYTWALYFSQFFWVTHNRVFNFFLDEYVADNAPIGTVLEVPTGTGLFLTHFLIHNPTWHGTGVDISDSAIDYTKQILNIYNIPKKDFEIVKEDIYKYEPGRQFDRIMCGEFLEHLEDPYGVLLKIYSLLKPGGRVFITVAVWAAMIDHIYLYKSADDVRKQIKEAGFIIEKELVQTVFKNRSPEDHKTPINYCAILTKQ